MGGLAAGALYEHLGAARTFAAFGNFAIFASIVLMVVNTLRARCTRPSTAKYSLVLSASDYNNVR